MLTRAIPLVLVMLGACHTTHDPKACMLIGTWERRSTMPSEVADTLAELVPQSSLRAQEMLWATETFEDDDVLSIVAERDRAACRYYQWNVRPDGVALTKITDPLVYRGTWRVVSQGHCGIVVEVDHPLLATMQIRELRSIDDTTLRFNETYGDGAFERETRMVRVAAK